MANEEKKPVTAQAKGSAVKRTDKKLGFFERTKKWFREMRSELKKVVWPTPKQWSKNTPFSNNFNNCCVSSLRSQKYFSDS